MTNEQETNKTESLTDAKSKEKDQQKDLPQGAVAKVEVVEVSKNQFVKNLMSLDNYTQKEAGDMWEEDQERAAKIKEDAADAAAKAADKEDAADGTKVTKKTWVNKFTDSSNPSDVEKTAAMWHEMLKDRHAVEVDKKTYIECEMRYGKEQNNDGGDYGDTCYEEAENMWIDLVKYQDAAKDDAAKEDAAEDKVEVVKGAVKNSVKNMLDTVEEQVNQADQKVVPHTTAPKFPINMCMLDGVWTKPLVFDKMHVNKLRNLQEQYFKGKPGKFANVKTDEVAIWVQGESQGKLQPELLKNHETMRFYNIQKDSCAYAHLKDVQPPQDLDASLSDEELSDASDKTVRLKLPPSELTSSYVYQNTRGKEKARQQAMQVRSGLSVEVTGLDHTTTGQRLLDMVKARGFNCPGLKIIRKRTGEVLDPEKVIEDLKDGETFEASIGGLSGGTDETSILQTQRFFDCVLCGKRCAGWGHNPSPLRDEGRCCLKCNNAEVIRARIYQIVLMHRAQQQQEDEEDATEVSSVVVEDTDDEEATVVAMDN